MNRTVTLLFATLLSGMCLAAEPETAPKPGDQELFEKLLGDTPDASPEAPANPALPESDSGPSDAALGDDATVSRIGADLRDASRLIQGKQTGRPTQATQRRVIDDLARLIDLAKNQSSQARNGQPNQTNSGRPEGEPGSAESPPAGQAPMPGAATGTPAGMPGRNRPGKADESSDRSRDDRLRDALRDFRSDLARDEWGHLPPRLREELLNAGSDEYLPQYDSLVRRYFESLAQPDPMER